MRWCDHGRSLESDFLRIGVASHDSYDVLVQRTRDAGFWPAVAGLPLHWVLRAEPGVLPLADTARKDLFDPVFTLQDQAYCRLTRLDRVVIGWLPGSGHVDCGGAS